jgi:opacity protein-like surface antigen
MLRNKATLFALTTLLLSSSAFAADVFSGDKSLKDDKNYSSGEVHNWEGWYLTGKLGVAKQEYEGSRRYSGSQGDYDVDRAGPDRDITTLGDNTTDAVRYEEPSYLWGGSAPYAMETDDNLDGTIEISRVSRLGGIMLEPYVSFSMPLGGKAEAGTVYTYDVAVTNEDGDPLVDRAASGYVEAEKRFDAAAGLKIGFVPVSRLYVYAGAGLNWGFFNVKGFNDVDPTDPSSPYATSFSDKDNAIGYEVLLGAKYAINNRVLIGVEGSWKEWGGLEGGSSRLTDDGSATSGDYVRAGGKNTVDAEEFGVKGTVTFKLSD